MGLSGRGLHRAVVVVLLEVFEQARPGRLPSEQLPGDDGGDGTVQGDEVSHEAEVFRGVFGGHRGRRDVEVAAYRPGDLPEGNALIRDGVQDRAGGSGLDGQAGQAGGVGTVHRRPPVRAVTHVSGDASLAMPTSVATNPLSPSPCTVGAKRKTDERTPMPLSDRVSRAVAARRPAGLARTSGLATSPSSSVATRPAVRPIMPEARTKGRSESARAAPMASTARRSAAPAAAKLPPKATSCWKARWITPSESAAALARPSGSSRSPCWTVAPAASSRCADASERARPTTSWPAPSSSGTTAEPIHPDAPVTKILMTDLQRAKVMSVTVITVDVMSVTVNT